MRDIKTEIIDKAREIGDLVDWLISHHASPDLYEPTMYIDLEGVNFCREGSLSILTLLIDIGIPSMRVFFDVRNDSDTLYAHFGVALQGEEDVQLMESATRTTTSSRKYLNGLAKCIEQSGLDNRDLTSWKLAKEKGEQLFKVQFGGSYEVFEQRPIRNDIISYCVGDVQHLHKLRSK
ncbi:hypothetical protein BOTCAL_1352g00020 [Botryotinia calthae]|uniref:3'-5' exonuclease domain-containing protein n=1 Tax=Botryotinia calthae TaxID=38488 RepID=A0A4Y8CED6_9HELO|nr:hypothetical protein BOTCAL_1352g00020 [Botryotinia calthae]